MANEMGIYSIMDRVSQEFSPPNVCKNDGVAFRQFQGEMAKVPPYAAEDYWLMKLGFMDMETGNVTGMVKPERIEGFEHE